MPFRCSSKAYSQQHKLFCINTMLRVELHCHTSLSACSGQTLDQIMDTCQKKNINVIAITDHDETRNAFELQKRARKNLQVIIGEEISTQSGEVIGYFLKKTIPSGLTLTETYTAIKEQGGLIAIPHPTDKLRKKVIDSKNMLRSIDAVDIIEIFNSRNMLWWNNWQAKKLALHHHKTVSVGSDAHFQQEIGRSLMLMERWSNPQEFLQNLRKANLITKHSSPAMHWLTWLEKRRKTREH